MDTFIDTVVIGGGQAGLAVARELKLEGRPLVVLDAHERVGDAWRRRWDSLHLNTPAKYDGLPGARFDAPRLSYPSKDDMADFLERYAAEHDIPVRLGTRVGRLAAEGDEFAVEAGQQRWIARNIVIATGCHQVDRVPRFAEDLAPAITRLTSSEYRNPEALPEGPVLVVGCGNSGAEIARDIARSHEVALSGRIPGQLPIRHGPAVAMFLFPLVRFAGTHVLTVDTPIGRKVEPHFRRHSPPLIRTRVPELKQAGVRLVPRTVGVSQGRPQLEDGTALDVNTVIWCIGQDEDFSWVDLPAFEDGRPEQYRGVVRDHPGLYLIGLEFLFAEGSGTLPGLGRDARYVARHIARHRPVTVSVPAG
jgi:putative flavoprotein involved in K+ transport